MNTAVVSITNLSHRYGKNLALDNLSLTLPAGASIGLVGPDGVGKSTLLSVIAGIKIIQTGTVTVFGSNIANKTEREALSRRIAFMPQGLGQNLYPTLSIYENIDFHARLFSIPAREREARIDRLLEATALAPFRERAAGKLSGGMKQKLSLCCALVHDPELLILDEPTTGVDPLSRRQFWQLVADLRAENPNMTVIVATAYIDEAEQFEHFIAMDAGKVLANAPTATIIAPYRDNKILLPHGESAENTSKIVAKVMKMTGNCESLNNKTDKTSARPLPENNKSKNNNENNSNIINSEEKTELSNSENARPLPNIFVTPLEMAYNDLLPDDKRGNPELPIPPFEPEKGAPPAMEAHGLTKRFGDFVAVNDVSFRIEKGEIFGFLGSNGCGKSTTMKMLTGLLEPTSGSAELLGETIEAGWLESRLRVGYMSQAFSLYEEMSVRKNLQMHATLYRLRGRAAKKAVQESLARYELQEVADVLPRYLSLGMRQRLQLAAACLHHPEVLILDEPTSGVDPAARDHFWEELIRLSREERITIFVSTHFMSEAARCDRISFMHRGQVLDMGTPEELRQKQGAKTLEEAFICYLEQAAAENLANSKNLNRPAHDNLNSQNDHNNKNNQTITPAVGVRAWLSLVFTFARREARELLRDPVRLFFALFGPVALMATAALAISFDIRQINFAVYDQDKSNESQLLLQQFYGSSYFHETAPVFGEQGIRAALKSGAARLVIEIPPNFGRDMLRGEKPEVGFFIDGAEPFFAENIKGMIAGVMTQYAQQKWRDSGYPIALAPPLETVPRFAYNQDFKSIFAITPGVIMMALMLIPVMMTTLGVVREKEIGSISNLYTSPASVGQFLLGKQLPYIATSLISYAILVWIAVALLGVPIKGSFLAMTLGALALIYAVTSFGLLISSLVSSQVAAMAAAALLTMIPAMNFSGMLYPVSTIVGSGRVMAAIFPAAHYQRISLGAFTKGQGAAAFAWDYVALVGFMLGSLLLAIILLKKQEK